MTLEEKLKMYKEKQRFVENVSGVFQVAPGCPSVEGVEYEVHTKDHGEGRIEIREWIIVRYTGGGWAPKIVSGNSNMANFVVIGSLLAGGHYEEVRLYQDQKALGFQRLEL
jgi:hypothetical protein